MRRRDTHTHIVLHAIVILSIACCAFSPPRLIPLFLWIEFDCSNKFLAIRYPWNIVLCRQSVNNSTWLTIAFIMWILHVAKKFSIGSGCQPKHSSDACYVCVCKLMNIWNSTTGIATSSFLCFGTQRHILPEWCVLSEPWNSFISWNRSRFYRWNYGKRLEFFPISKIYLTKIITFFSFIVSVSSVGSLFSM